MDLIPVNGHILVQLPKQDPGVYIPSGLSDSVQEGIVVNTAGDLPVALQFKVGTKIRWEKFAEADGSFKDGDDEYVLIKGLQVMASYPEVKADAA